MYIEGTYVYTWNSKELSYSTFTLHASINVCKPHCDYANTSLCSEVLSVKAL